MASVWAGKFGEIKVDVVTPKKICEALLLHPEIKRVWFNDQTGEYAVLTNQGVMATFHVGFTNEWKSQC